MTDKLRIRHVDPRSLIPHPDNPRDITPANKERLRRVITTFGFVEPLVVSKNSGYLLGGHQRREIALEDEIPEVPIVEIPDLSPDQERALIVALNNQEAQGRFDLEALTAILGPIEDTALLEASGFDFDQWQAIQLEVGAEALRAGREGITPPLADKGAKTRTKPGDVWHLGDHTLTVGDATTPDPYPDGRADMTFTDPPYGIGYEVGYNAPDERAKARRSTSRENVHILGDELKGPAFDTLITESLAQIVANTDGAIYLCHAAKNAGAIETAWREAGIHQSTTIAWVKDRFVLGRGDYQTQWEGILYGWPDGRGPDRYWIGSRTEANVWDHATGPSNVWRYKRPAASRLHPTMKPVSLVEHAIRNSCPPGGLVLDPFAGSGSTLIAAENIGRLAWLVEIDPRYADVILARYESLETGKEPTKQ